ncbi:hypothetical protein ACWENS_10590 [Streptomyces sp. NPDC004532]
MATQIVPAPLRADHQGMSLSDVIAHQQASHVTWRARERFLRSLAVNGRIPTAGDQLLADRAGHWAGVEVTVAYVSPVSPDGDVYLIVSSLDGAGRALAVIDGSEQADAYDWQLQTSISLVGRAIEIFDQPGIDLRRSTVQAVAA